MNRKIRSMGLYQTCPFVHTWHYYITYIQRAFGHPVDEAAHAHTFFIHPAKEPPPDSAALGLYYT